MIFQTYSTVSEISHSFSIFYGLHVLVVVQSIPNTPPLNLDTVLFLDRGQRPLGRIFDVLGNVREPLYSVRFNSREHIKEKNITKEQIVYCAPQTEYTSYVNTSELLRHVDISCILSLHVALSVYLC